MLSRTVVLNIVGLTPALLKRCPKLFKWSLKQTTATIGSVFPAVTTSVQSTYLTGKTPQETGIVGNGWYFRELAEVKFWHQSNHLVHAPKVWDLLREKDPSFTCANLFWWYNMYSSADFSVTPRPIYRVDGRKLPDIYTEPLELREVLLQKLGQFPLFHFWGPNTSIASSRWIARSALYVEESYAPALSLVYIPHLDYNLQRKGTSHPSISQDLLEVDELCSELIRFYESKSIQIVILSEYGITDVSTPIHINRALREAGFLRVRDEQGHETLDCGASAAFAVADHQIAHIYVREKREINKVRSVLETIPGIDQILDQEGKARCQIDHPRAGELIAVADKHSWFTYYFWHDDVRAPDYARTVDIHRKPGYDPLELFIDPEITFPRLRVGTFLAKKMLGFRGSLSLIPLDATLIKGSHGRMADSTDEGPIFITSRGDLVSRSHLDPTEISTLLTQHVASDLIRKVA